MRKSHVYVGLVIALTVGFAGCVHTYRDCGLGVAVRTWVDENANGIWDQEEPPLAGVVVHTSGTNPLTSMTNAQGEAQVEDWSPGCGPEGIRVWVEPPSGFRPTTRSSVNVNARSQVLTLTFGFDYDPRVPTATPKPVALRCELLADLLPWERPSVQDVAVDSDGGIWVATYGEGLGYYNADQERKWVYRDELVSPYVNSVALAEDGSVWVGTSEGVSHRQDGSWTSYTAADGLVGEHVYDIAFGSDGAVWLATDEGVGRFDPVADKWSSYASPCWALTPPHDGVGPNHIDAIAVAPDGDVWAVQFHGILSHLVLSGDLGVEARWVDHIPQSLAIPAEGPRLPMEVGGIEMAQGYLWLTGFGGLIRFDPATAEIVHYSLEVSDQPGLGESTTAAIVTPEGWLWIGTYGRGVVRFWPESSGEAGRQLVVYNVADGLVSNYVRSLAMDAEGGVWIGTVEGASYCTLWEDDELRR